MKRTVAQAVFEMVALMGALGAAGCEPGLTAIVVEVTSDLPAGVLDGFTVRVLPEGCPTSEVQVLRPPPDRVAFTPYVQGLPAPTFEAVGRQGQTEVGSAKAMVAFWEGHVVVLRLALLAECSNRSCALGETCQAAVGCAPVPIFRPQDLPLFNARDPLSDAAAGQSSADAVGDTRRPAGRGDRRLHRVRPVGNGLCVRSRPVRCSRWRRHS